jgi:hypothetical protein
MSRKERVIAGLLLVVAVVGGALIPRLLAAPATPLGIALGPGPSPSVVQAPTIPKTEHNTSGPTASLSSGAVASSAVPVTPVVVQPTQATNSAGTKQTPSSSAQPPAVTVPLSPAPPVTQSPAAANHQPVVSITSSGQAKTPPGQAKKLSGLRMTPPGLAKTPSGQAKKLSGPAKTPPGQAKKLNAPGPPAPAKPAAKAGWRNTRPDLPGSGHGRKAPQAPPHPVGSHHRSVGHLAPPASRPAPATRESRPQARPENRGRSGKGSHGTPPPAPPVAPGHGNHGNGKGRS